MSLSVEFISAVDTGNILRTKIMMKDSLINDPSGKLFDEMEEYIMKSGMDIYVQHNGDVLNENQTSWTNEYLNKQLPLLINNFSKKRADFLKKMVRYIYKDKVEKTESQNNHQEQKTLTRKQIGIGVTAVGAVTAITGLCISQLPVTICGAAVAVVGIGLIISDGGTKNE